MEEKMEKVKLFDKSSKATYKIINIDKGNNLGGDFGNVYHGTMINTSNPNIYTPIILKTCKKKCRHESKKVDGKKVFKHEKEMCKFLSELKNTPEEIVMCYGTIKKHGKEYIVMEDLKAQGFETIKDICAKLEKPKTFNITTRSEYEDYKQKIIRFFEATGKLKTLKEILTQIPIEHNDVHSGNVMVNLDTCKVKLIDLGLSSIKQGDSVNCLGKIDGGGVYKYTIYIS